MNETAKQEEKSFFSMPQYDAANAQRYAEEYYNRNRPEQTYEDMFGKYIPAPKETYDPKQEKRMLTAAVAAEGLKSLAEIFAQGKGAHIERREPVETDRAQKRIEYARNKYDGDLREYNRLRLSTREKDTERERALRAQAETYGQNLAQMLYGQDVRQFEYERNKKDKAADEQKGFERKKELLEAGHKNSMALQTNAQRFAAQSNAQKNNPYRISIRLKPEDTVSRVDRQEGDVRTHTTDFGESEIDAIIAEAAMDGTKGKYAKDIFERDPSTYQYRLKNLTPYLKHVLAAQIMQDRYDNAGSPQGGASVLSHYETGTSGGNPSRFNK